MDKLEPVLKHHFWILLVPLLSMNLWGYFSANSALKDATKSREDKLNSVKSGIPAGANAPNEKYTEELSKLNDALEKDVNEELKQLWTRQQARMTWPQVVAAKIPAKYRDEIKESLVRFSYQNVYQAEVIKPLFESVEPVVPNPKDLNYVPKVDFPYALIPQLRLGNNASITTISSKQMWDAQEDVWVTQLILDAIRQMNKDADSTSSAVIRRVIAFRLLGGDGTPAVGTAAAEGDSMTQMGADGGMSGGMGGQRGGGAGAIQTSVKFNPAEEFGVGGEAQSSTGMGGLTAMSSGMTEGGEAGDGSAPAEILRYVGKENPEAKFDERGFYLSVIINQNKLVDFLVALSNSEWPVRVVRFQFGKNPWKTDEFRSTTGGLGNPMAMMGAGGSGSLGSLGALSARGSGAPTSGSGFDPSGSGDPASGFGALGGLPGGDIAPGMGGGGNTGYKITDLDHPDLIQLDLCGLVTIFRQPAEEAPTEATGEQAPPANSAESNANPTGENPNPAAPAADPSAPEAGGTAAPAAPAPGTPPAAESDPAAPAPAADPGAGTTPSAPAQDATPAPAGEAATEGSTPQPPAESPKTP